jgi:hypothetical protein
VCGWEPTVNAGGHRDEHDQARVRVQEAKLSRRASSPLQHQFGDPVPLGIVSGASPLRYKRQLQRLEMSVNILDMELRPQRRLNAFGDVVSGRERNIGIHLQVQRHADATVVAVDRDVVHVANKRLSERQGQGAVAQAEGPLGAARDARQPRCREAT